MRARRFQQDRRGLTCNAWITLAMYSGVVYWLSRERQANVAFLPRIARPTWTEKKRVRDRVSRVHDTTFLGRPSSCA